MQLEIVTIGMFMPKTYRLEAPQTVPPTSNTHRRSMQTRRLFDHHHYHQYCQPT